MQTKKGEREEEEKAGEGRGGGKEDRGGENGQGERLVKQSGPNFKRPDALGRNAARTKEKREREKKKKEKKKERKEGGKEGKKERLLKKTRIIQSAPDRRVQALRAWTPYTLALNELS